MSLDAANGAVDGVKFLAMQAMQAGATKEEVMQAVRITQYIFGVSSVVFRFISGIEVNK
jgi:alkylhydroperoxidase/carboxymuconolactone decarboxylase family protein YurZ